MKQEKRKEKIVKDDKIELTGIVTDCLPSTFFKVQVEGGAIVLATLAGKLRQNRIRLLVGDRVKVEVSTYDCTRGRVVWRS